MLSELKNNFKLWLVLMENFHFPTTDKGELKWRLTTSCFLFWCFWHLCTVAWQNLSVSSKSLCNPPRALLDRDRFALHTSNLTSRLLGRFQRELTLSWKMRFLKWEIWATSMFSFQRSPSKKSTRKRAKNTSCVGGERAWWFHSLYSA